MTTSELAGVLRRIRYCFRLSQRELARTAGVSHTLVGAIEAGQINPSLRAVATILESVGCTLAVLGPDGKPIRPDEDGLRDRGWRRYPAHVDVRPVGPHGEGWWGRLTVQDYIRKRPTHTFDLNRLDYPPQWRLPPAGGPPDPGVDPPS